MRRKASIALGASVIALLTGALAPNAMAATKTAPTAHTHAAGLGKSAVPFDATGCNGDVCMYLSTPSGGEAYVHAWAYSTTYYGFFILTGPDSLWRESATKTWYGGGDYGTTANFGGNFAAVVGQYCVTFYQALSNEDVEQGRACESIE